MKKNVKTLLSLFLATAILLTQASVFAVPLTDSISKIPVSDVFVVAEDVSKRGEFEKHYLCSDGTFIVTSYAEAIHYKNENGEWVDVDNEVSYNKLTQRYSAGNEVYGVEFASISDTSKLVTMKSGEHTISWGLTTDKSTSADATVKSATVSSITAEETVTPSVTLKNAVVSTKNSKSLVTDAKTFELSKVSGGIAYENIIVGAPEISVDYSVYRNKIEEDIYINSKTDIKSISMNLSVGTLVARANSDNSVSLLDDAGEAEYTIGVPYMEDAAGEILNDIRVTVTQSGSNCVVTYTPDETWLNSEERVYPILLDPSITTREYSSNIVDTYVYEGNTANHSSEQKNYVGIRNSKINRTFIKITNLPAIDQSMPVIGATLTLTLPSPTASGHRVALYKLSSDWNPSTVTYANQPSFSESGKIGTCDFDSSTKKYVFDLTADMARMYNEFLAGVNYGYVLKYDNESKTDPDYNSTYSMERTTVADRPLLTITYGYSLPTGLSDGGVYALQNRGSYGYLTVHGGTDADNVNVYLKSTLSADIATNQQFKLEYVSATGAYRLRPMHSSNGSGRVLDVVKSGGYVVNGGNLQMTALSGAISNEWFFVGTGTNAFKIIPRTNMALSLTAYPGLDGTADGTTPTSKGNVFVATAETSSDFQQWRIIDMSTGEAVSVSGNYAGVPNGTYYINNVEYGKYMCKPSSAEYVDGQSGLISNLGNSIRWTVTCVYDGMYTIRSTDDPTLFVVPNDAGLRIVLDTLPSGADIPDEYLWKIFTAHGGGVTIQNVATGGYLCSLGTTNSLHPKLPSTTSESYDRYAWRMANVNLYGNTSEHSYRELSSQTTLIFNGKVGKAGTVSVDRYYGNELWVGMSDFEYPEIAQDLFEYDQERNKFIPKNETFAIISARHKPTGQEIIFRIDITPLMVYQSPSTYYNDKEGNRGEDILFCDKDASDMIRLIRDDWEGMLDWSADDLFDTMEYGLKAFSEGELESVALDMMNHFRNGHGAEYSNVVLTNAAFEHDSTQTYMNSIERYLNDFLEDHNDFAEMEYVSSSRETTYLVERLAADDQYQPTFDSFADFDSGLMVCVHGLWGNQIEVVSFESNDSSYTITLKYTLYDHFGLDANDVSTYYYVDSFAAWYILQHYNRFMGQYKPFLTLMTLEKTVIVEK